MQAMGTSQHFLRDSVWDLYFDDYSQCEKDNLLEHGEGSLSEMDDPKAMDQQ